jgi:hypothetical protein
MARCLFCILAIRLVAQVFNASLYAFNIYLLGGLVATFLSPVGEELINFTSFDVNLEDNCLSSLCSRAAVK